MSTTLRVALTAFAALAPTSLGAGQEPAPAPSGKLERHASGSSSHASRSSDGTTKSWRRVVKDGVVVEEGGSPSPALERWSEDGLRGEVPDAARILEELRRKSGVPNFVELPGFGELPPLDDKGAKTSTSSHSRRVVVVNGETIVDEETRDGVPVRGSAGGARPAPLDSFPLPGRAEARAEAHASGSASHSERSEASDSSSGSESGDSGSRDGRGADSSKKRVDPAKPFLPKGAGRVRVGEPMPVRPLPPAPTDVAPRVHPTSPVRALPSRRAP
jgi:hypothetical protein